MNKYKILTVVGTRPEIIRLSRCLSLFDKLFDHVLVYTNQNYDPELSRIFFKDLDLKKPDYIIKHSKKQTFDILSKNLIEIQKIILKEKPDGFVVLGDTNSALTAYVAKRNKIPLFHIEAGNRCFDQNVPEEINRKIIDHISDLNIVYSGFARENLINEGISNNSIVKLGSPLFEVINFYNKKFSKSRVLKKYNLKSNNYFLISFHREENLLDNNKINEFIKIINFVSKETKNPVLVSAHPRLRNILKKKTFKKKLLNSIRIMKPFNFSDYVTLQMGSRLVISDSGSIPEEASILNLNSIILRDTFERQEIFEKTSTIVSNLELNSFKKIFQLELNNLNLNRSLTEYENSEFSKNLCKIIASKIPYINKYIWNKKS
tara:strand:- start:41 stop:1168 length:1128 start_codon:yes stop_codon:yes gene_type:complete